MVSTTGRSESELSGEPSQGSSGSSAHETMSTWRFLSLELSATLPSSHRCYQL
jgi:hypothetical protein